MIRIRVLGMPQEGGTRLVYIGQSVNFGPSDQSDLKGQHRCNLGGGGRSDIEAEDDMWVPQASHLQVGLARSTYQPLRVCFGDLPSGVF
jgi:hypothetical protein